MVPLIMYGDRHPTWGWALGGPAFVILGVLLVAGTVLVVAQAAAPAAHGYGDRQRSWPWGLTAGLIVLLFVLAAGARLFWPPTSAYHSWQQVSGVVVRHHSGTDLHHKYVVTLKGSHKRFGCNDDRCGTVHKGDQLKLECKRVFRWPTLVPSGYHCRVDDFTKKGHR